MAEVQTHFPKWYPPLCLAGGDPAFEPHVDTTLMLALILFLFKGKRIPPTKTRPLKQGSKKALLDGDAQAAGRISAEPVLDESKRLQLQGSEAAPLLPNLGTEK